MGPERLLEAQPGRRERHERGHGRRRVRALVQNRCAVWTSYSSMIRGYAFIPRVLKGTPGVLNQAMSKAPQCTAVRCTRDDTSRYLAHSWDDLV